MIKSTLIEFLNLVSERCLPYGPQLGYVKMAAIGFREDTLKWHGKEEKCESYGSQNKRGCIGFVSHAASKQHQHSGISGTSHRPCQSVTGWWPTWPPA